MEKQVKECNGRKRNAILDFKDIFDADLPTSVSDNLMEKKKKVKN